MTRFPAWTEAPVAAALALACTALFARLLAWDLSGPAAAAAAAAVGAAAWLKFRPTSGEGNCGDLAALALASACAAPWVTALAWLGGGWTRAFAWAAGACVLGASFCRPALLSRGTRALAAGAGGLLLLAFWRFLGMNNGEAQRLVEPLLSRRDHWLLTGQMAAALCAWFWTAAPVAASRTALPTALLGLCGGAALAELWGTLPTAVAACAGLLVLGALRLRAAWAGQGLARGALLALAAACALLAVLDLRLFRDVWLARLDSAHPGGDYLAFVDSRGEALAAYRFSSDLPVLLRNGVADAADPRAARRLASLSLLLARGARMAPERLLLVEPRHPVTLETAAAIFAQVDWLERRRADAVLAALAGSPSWRPPAGVRRLRRGLFLHLCVSGGYDAVILDLPAAPGGAGATAARLGVATLKRARAALAPGGLFAARLPPGWEERRAELAAAARATFSHAGILETPGLALLAASDAPLDGSGTELLARMTDALRRADPALAADSARFAWYNLIR